MTDLEKVRNDGNYLKHIKFQTPELCLEAVKENGWALQFVKTQTPELCLEAVKENGYALQFVETQTPEICLAAVKQDGHALVHVRIQTTEICLGAIQQNTYTLQYIDPKFLNNDIYVVSIRGESIWRIFGIDKLRQYFPGKDIERDLDLYRRIGENKNVLEALKQEIAFIRFTKSMEKSDYHELLDYIIESDIELTDHQREHLNRLEP